MGSVTVLDRVLHCRCQEYGIPQSGPIPVSGGLSKILCISDYKNEWMIDEGFSQIFCQVVRTLSLYVS